MSSERLERGTYQSWKRVRKKKSCDPSEALIKRGTLNISGCFQGLASLKENLRKPKYLFIYILV
jgi:hypothetical protein